MTAIAAGLDEFLKNEARDVLPFVGAWALRTVWLRGLTLTFPAVASVSWLVWDTLVHLGDEVSPISVLPHHTDLVHG